MPTLPFPSSGDEARRTNVLLEAMQKDIHLLAEGMVDVRREVTGLSQWRVTVTEEIAEIKGILRQHSGTLQQHSQTLREHGEMLRQHSKDIAENTAGMHRIEHSLTSFDHRLTAVEAKRGV